MINKNHVLFLISLLLALSCKKSEKDVFNENLNLKVSKTVVKPYEIVNLVFNDNLKTKYTGKFGDKGVEIIKTSDSTLSFFVPEIKSGIAVLKFELGDLKFTVSNLAEVNTIEVVNTFSNLIDSKIGLLKNSSLLEKMEVDSLKKYKSDVIKLFSSMPKDQQRQAALFYEANKEIFTAFSNHTFNNLNASTTTNSISVSDNNSEVLSQSDCPRTDFKTFYGCTADNLALSAFELKKVSVEFLKMVGMASVMAGVAYNTSVLGPVAWGITAVGISLPLGAAAFMLFTEIRPAVIQFKSSLYPFLRANWIFGKALFEAVTEVFQSEISASLNLLPKFRSMNSDDRNVSAGCSSFISSFASLKDDWDKLSSYFGVFPSYILSEQTTSLSSNDVVITNISSGNVQLLSNSGQDIKFKSLNGTDQSFTYKITVKKQGFIEEKTVNATLKGIPDSTALYRQSLLGNYALSSYGAYQLGNGPTTRIDCDIREGGYCDYTIYDDPSWPNGHRFYNRWVVQKINNEYFFTSTYTNPDHRLDVAQKLSYPVTSFVYMHRYTKK
jgi:hypothetical protein